MKVWALRVGTVLAFAFLGFTVLNASWLAPDPRGGVKLVAHRAVAQLPVHEVADPDSCTAGLIEQPFHDYLENTARSVERARLSSAQLTEVDVVPTADGEIALFGDPTLDCRTNGSGPAREATMAELKALDAGHGYSADGGKTFPLRGKGVGQIPTLAEALRVMPRDPLLFDFTSDDPADAELLAAKLEEGGRDVAKVGDAFHGPPAVIARVRELFPGNWAWDDASAEQCSSDYVLFGWTGILPDSCKGGTMAIRLDRQFAYWGWPNRLIARMEAHGGRVLVVGPVGLENGPRGLVFPEQLGEVPSSFNGFLWVEDIWTIGPSLRPSMDRRRREEQLAAIEGIERRRAAYAGR